MVVNIINVFTINRPYVYIDLLHDGKIAKSETQKLEYSFHIQMAVIDHFSGALLACIWMDGNSIVIVMLCAGSIVIAICFMHGEQLLPLSLIHTLPKDQ